MQANDYAKHVTAFAMMEEQLSAARATIAALEATAVARETHFDDLEARHANVIAERDHACARATELETQFRSFGALVADALHLRERHNLPALRIPPAPVDDEREAA